MYDKILVPFDGSVVSQNGLNMACVLAEHHNAKLILLCVADDEVPAEIVNAAVDEGIVRPASYMEFSRSLEHPSMAPARAEATRQAVMERVAHAIAVEIVDRGARFAGEQNVPEVLTLVRDGDPEKCILQEAAGHNVDLIVIGSRGKEGLDALFHPSVAEHVRKRSACPCLVLFPGDDE